MSGNEMGRRHGRVRIPETLTGVVSQLWIVKLPLREQKHDLATAESQEVAEDPLELWVSKLPKNPAGYVYATHSRIGCSDAGISDNRDLSSLARPLIPGAWEVEVGGQKIQDVPRLQSNLGWGCSLVVASLPGVCKAEGSVSPVSERHLSRLGIFQVKARELSLDPALMLGRVDAEV